MKRSPLILLATVIFVIVLSAFIAAWLPKQAGAAITPQQAVQRAWELAKQSGAYRFTAKVNQFVVPLPIPSNVGRQSTEQTARLEGTVDLAGRKMAFSLFSQGSPALDPQSGLQVKIDGDKAYSRQGNEAWREMDNFASAVAPQSDFMAFLSGAKNITLAPESVSASEVKHYTFDIDGPGFAAYMQTQLMDQLAAQGKLPPNVQVDLAAQFAALSGTGEIWIDADGLPVRQLLHVQFPATAADQTQADIRVDFKDFAPLPAAAAAPSLAGSLLTGLQSRNFSNALLACAFLALLGLGLLAGLRSKPVYAALVVVTLLAMVFGPLLQSAKAAGFMEEQLAKAAAERQHQLEADVAQTVKQPATPQFDPHTSPLQSARQAAAAQALSAAPDVSPFQAEPTPQPLEQLFPAAAPGADELIPAAMTSTVDSDHDGLPDDQEALLGTDPTVPDTDGDTITDTLEVVGFTTPDGKRWYGDPLNPDTNEDGVSDAAEWNKDTNKDGTPDLWSRDNDGDGVPDSADLSPFQQGARQFDSSHPISLTINSLTPGLPTYVEFQLRPVITSHLRYAYNVLDWPKGDVQGQMMDTDGATFKDVFTDTTLLQDAYGDVKLVPMLEIIINGTPTNLPDEQTLKGYGISVQDLDTSGARKAAYVPLQVTKDGDNWVAFYGKMFYTPGVTWGSPQQVRLVWVVQALVDVCAEDGFKDGKCKTFEAKNELQVIQTYADPFTLTGLNVREDHGNMWEVAYKDPAAITQTEKAPVINRFTPLNDLVFGLDHSFLAGTLDENGNRDFPVTEVRRRFDHTINASVPVSPTRFGISDNVLLVKPLSYKHIDLAYQQISMTETKNILNVYTPYWTAGKPVTPTLLFAHEEYYRPLNLDSQGVYSNVTVTGGGTTYVLELPGSVPSGSKLSAIDVYTATALNWAPYMYQNGAWAGAPLDVYLNDLTAIYPPETIDPDPAVAQGALMFMQAYYANIYQGYYNVVEIGTENLPSSNGMPDELIAEYMENWEMVFEPFKIGLESFFEIQAMYRVVDAVKWVKVAFTNLSWRINGFFGITEQFHSTFHYEHFSKGGLLAEGLAAIAWLVTHIPPIHEKLDESVWGQLFIVSISASFVAIGIHKGVEQYSHLFGGQGGGGHAANGSKSSSYGIIAMIVVSTILVLVNVGVFIYTMCTAGDIDGVQTGLMVANLIANIIVSIAFVLISAIPVVGPIIVAVYNLINTILSEFLGFSLTEKLVESIAGLFYSVDSMTELAPQVGETVYGFLKDTGIAVGNAVNISFPVEVTATMKDPMSWWQATFTTNEYEKDLLDTETTLVIDENESAITEPSQWHDKTLDHTAMSLDLTMHHINWPMYSVRGDMTGVLDTIEFTAAGLNKTFDFTQEFKFKVHVYSCILRVYCTDEVTSGSSEDEPPPMVFDVFPATLDEFYAWNWSGDSKLPFPALHDRDNDGLISPLYQGADLNDNNWDIDGDLLSDGWEANMAATPPAKGGYAFSMLKADSDGDGLLDGDEARLSTDPAFPDSDQDGRSDRAEADGYLFTYAAGKQTLVSSAPLLADSDSDGLRDDVEYSLHLKSPIEFPYNPRVVNTTPLGLSAQAAVQTVLPGTSVPFTATLQNNSGIPANSVMTSTMVVGGMTQWGTVSSLLYPQTTITQVLTYSVGSSAKNGPTPITTTVCAELDKPLVYYSFDEPSGAKTFDNQVGALYDATCVGQLGCPIAGGAGRLGKAVHFNAANQRLLINQSAADLSFDGAHPFSLSLWMKGDAIGGANLRTLITKSDNSGMYNGYNLFLQNARNGGYYGSFNNQQMNYWYYPNAPTYMSPNTWYNLIAIAIGSKLKYYVNGVEIAGTQGVVKSAPSSAQVQIGAISDRFGTPGVAYGLPFTGWIDELYIYDRVLSDQEIYQLSHPDTLASGPEAAVSCELSSSAVTTVTVDTDLPTAAFTSPSANAYLDGAGYLIVGGTAADPTSYIRSVEISMDNGAFQPANGTESWAYTLDLRSLKEGSHFLDARATDAVGHKSNTTRVTFHIDRMPPGVSFYPNTPWQVQAHAVNRWFVLLEGSATDPESGVDSVEVLLDGGQSLPNSGWQPATVSSGHWSLEYPLPLNTVNLAPVPSPDGVYTVTVRAADKVGNAIPEASYVRRSLTLDNTPPQVSLTSLSPTATVTTPLTISGRITDTSGISALKVALLPMEQAQVSKGAALAVHFNETKFADGNSYLDGSGYNQTGTSDAQHAPQTGWGGKVDEAVLFDGVDDVVTWKKPLEQSFTNTLTAAVWFKTSGSVYANPTLLALDQSAGLYWAQGALTFFIKDADGQGPAVSSGMTLTDNAWHHAVGTWDGKTLSIYIDGALARTNTPYYTGLMNTTNRTFMVGNSWWMGGAYRGLIDELYLFRRAFTAQEAANLYQQGNMTWQNATLAQSSGPTANWSYALPGTLDGLYQLNLRGIDRVNNRSDNPTAWDAWQGEIDLLAPRVTITRTNLAGSLAQVTCTSTDFNLTQAGYFSPCPLLPTDKTYYYQVSNWYKNAISDTTRLYQVRNTCQVDTNITPPLLKACDRYGRCTIVGAVQAETDLQSLPDAAALPVSLVVTPTDRSAITALNPLELSAGAEASTGLQAVTVTLDGGLLYTFTFPDASLTQTVTTTTWTPAPDLAEGAHALQAEAADWNGQVQAQPFTTTLFVDLQSPTVDVSPAVYTTSQMISTWGVKLGGPVSDTAGVAGVEVLVNGVPIQRALDTHSLAVQSTESGAGDPPGETSVLDLGSLAQPQNPASVENGRWSYPWGPLPLPDGDTFNITARATDLGGHVAETTQPVVVDIVPPAQVTVTLAYFNAEGALIPLAEGDIIRDVRDPLIQIAWTPSADRGGLGNYLVGLSEAELPDPVTLTPVDPAGPLTFNQVTSEAHSYTAYVVSQDRYGNRTWNRFGPLYVDTPLTPDLMPLPATPNVAASGGMYQGWLNSGASLVGTSRLISETAVRGASLHAIQQFHVTWDESALRLNWIGANWNTDGDLYIYLRTGSGQATDQAYNPYPATANDSVTLPFAADTLVLVKGKDSAMLLRWDGAQWADAIPGGLQPDTFQFTQRVGGATTDLYLPFALLGIADPADTPLDLIAFASQKDALRLWSVQPVINPHDSPVLTKLFELLPDQHHLVLRHAFHWPSLALGQRPDLDRYLDVDVRSLIIANPTGVITDTRMDGLYWPSLFQNQSLIPLVGNGQVITYNLYYLNLGRASVPDQHLTLAITATGSLVLPDGHLIITPDGLEGYRQEIDLGPITPGARGKITFTGVVDAALMQMHYEACRQAHPDDPAACTAIYDLVRKARVDTSLTSSLASSVVINNIGVQHPVVADPPVDVAVTSPQDSMTAALAALSPEAQNPGLAPEEWQQALSAPPIYVLPGAYTLQGTAVDPSGVATVKVEVLDLNGDVSQTTCDVADPQGGVWTCGVILADADDGVRYLTRAQAANVFGYSSEWSAWRVLVVDTTPPGASLDLASQVTLSNTVLGLSGALLSGRVADNDRISSATLCFGEIGEARPYKAYLPFLAGGMAARAAVPSEPAAPDEPAPTRCVPLPLDSPGGLSGAWSYTLLVLDGVDYASQALWVYGLDAAGNRSTLPLQRTYWFDTMAPKVTLTIQVGSVSLAAYTAQPAPILAGTATDGSGAPQITVRMTSAATGTRRVPVPVVNNRWSFMPTIDQPGTYSLYLEARDLANNLAVSGPWTLEVTTP